MNPNIPGVLESIMYFFNVQDGSIWNSETLTQFSLNNVAKTSLKRILTSKDFAPTKADRTTREALEKMGINIEDIQIWSDFSRSLRTPIVHIIRNCNSPCVMCDCWKTKGRHFIEVDTAISLFTQLKDAGASSIMISGGEPTLHPHLKDILEACKHLNLSIELNTNGFLLHKLEWLEDLSISALVVSMDGYDPKSYQLMRGANKFERVIENVKRFKVASPRTIVGLRCTLTRTTLNGLENLPAILEQIGGDVVSFSPLDVGSASFAREMTSTRSAQLSQLLLPPSEELQKILIQLDDLNSPFGKSIDQEVQSGRFAWGREDFIRCINYYLMVQGESEIAMKNYPELFDATPCRFPSTSLVVDYDQTLLPCFYGEPFSSAGDFESKHWMPLQLESQLEESGQCIGCRGKVFCPR